MITIKWFTFVMLILFGNTWADNSVDTADYSLFNCPDLKSQESLDLDGIMGKWYVVEILYHKNEPMGQASTARVVIDTCPVIKLKSDDRGLLRLLWKETKGDIEYTFRVPDPSRAPGLWHSAAQQNGTLTLKPYAQFVGKVYVMKAVGNHMVLTFCAKQPDNQLFSVLMSREHILQRSNIKGVHNLLGRRDLSILRVHETCAKGGTTINKANVFAISVCWLISLRLALTIWL